MDQSITPPLTLDDISKRKRVVKNEIEKQKEIIQERTKEIFSPQPNENGVNTFIQSFNKGLALYDGVMTGIKLMRKVRGMFTPRKDHTK